jgi:cytochrome c peroxidase
MDRPQKLRSQILLTTLGSLFFVTGCGKDSKPTEQSEPSPVPAKSAEQKAPATKRVDALKFPSLGDQPLSKENPQSDEKIALGHQLFFDKRLSVDGSVSCYSCHQNEDGNGGKTPLAIGAKDKKLTRHSPVMWNVGYLPALYWDGRSSSLEAQAKGAWGGGNMGVGADNLDKKAAEMAKLPEYKDAFEKAFPGQAVTGDLVAQALSTYERTLICGDTAYDKYAKGDKSALSDLQKDGLEVFTGKGMCTACHSPPFFSSAYFGSGTFFNVGVGTKGVEEKDVDVGRMAVSKGEKDWAAFKPPSLRNITKSAPYFHDGSVSDLKEAVKFMASGGHDNKNKSPLMSDKKLTDEEIDQIIAFLGALDCNQDLPPPSDGDETTTPKKAPTPVQN